MSPVVPPKAHAPASDAVDASSDPSLPLGLRVKARGAASNQTGRFEGHQVERLDDGWDIPEDERLLRTEIRLECPRSAITYNRSPDLPFDRSINPYRGCEHGCIYCFARPSHAFLNLSPGLDFETKLIARPGIAAVLERELAAKAYQVAPIALGTNTDPYQPCDRDHQLMRQILQVLSACDHPVAITTKGSLIERDLDLLGPMAAKGLVRVGISFASLDAGLARQLEPRAPAPARRLQMVRRLSDAGISVRLMLAPVIPGLTDPELEALLEAGRDAGAVGASWIALRLPREVAPLFRDWLEQHHPQRAAKVLARLKDMHGGKEYDPEWGKRMRGTGIWADLIAQRFDKALARLGLLHRMGPLRGDLFRPPVPQGGQLSLF